MSVAAGMISPQSASTVFEIVTKSAVRNTLVTPGRANNPEAISLSVGWEGTNVAGPPTGLPMVNLTALGLGVGSTCMIRFCP